MARRCDKTDCRINWSADWAVYEFDKLRRNRGDYISMRHSEYARRTIYAPLSGNHTEHFIIYQSSSVTPNSTTYIIQCLWIHQQGIGWRHASLRLVSLQQRADWIEPYDRKIDDALYDRYRTCRILYKHFGRLITRNWYEVPQTVLQISWRQILESHV